MNILRILYLTKRNKSKNNVKIESGFTLVELLVVVIIIGTLAIVSIPNVLIQVGKARSSEAKANLSSIGQSQQVYFLERATFADEINKLDVVVTSDGYYDYPDPIIVDPSTAKHVASNPDASSEATDNYAMGVYFVAGDFGIVLCESNDIGGVVEAPSSFTDACIGGTEIK